MTIQIKVTMFGIQPPIWRRILIPWDITLDELHAVLQGAFAWQNYHLYEFQIGNCKYVDRTVDVDAPIEELDTLEQPLEKLVKKAIISYTFTILEIIGIMRL